MEEAVIHQLDKGDDIKGVSIHHSDAISYYNLLSSLEMLMNHLPPTEVRARILNRRLVEKE